MTSSCLLPRHRPDLPREWILSSTAPLSVSPAVSISRPHSAGRTSRVGAADGYVDGMSDEPLTNAVVEWQRRNHERINTLDRSTLKSVPADSFLTGDYTWEDRRSRGFNFGVLHASDMDAYRASAFDASSGRMHISMPEVVAVRGQRIAAVVEVLDYGGGNVTDCIGCGRLDASLRRWERSVMFDVDARDDAIALLDEWQAEIDD